MLRVHGTTGCFEVAPDHEAKLRALSDYQLCVVLKNDPNNCEYLAEAMTRQGAIQYFEPWGFLPV